MSGTTGTSRTQSYLLTTEFQDGHPAGSISSQYMRDFITSVPNFSTIYNVRNYGAVWDGSAHPLSTQYATLGAAQAVYSFATALTQQLDWAAWQLAINKAAVSGGRVVMPAGVGVINDEITEPVLSNRNTSTNAVEVSGQGEAATAVVWQTDLGSGKFAIKSADRNGVSLCSYSNFSAFGPANGFPLGLPPTLSGVAVAMSGIQANSKDAFFRMRIQNFRAGVDVQGDHIFYENMVITNNYYGMYYSDGSSGGDTNQGDHVFINIDLTGNTFASFGFNKNNGIDHSTMNKVHTGFSPFCFYYEGDGTPGIRSPLTNTVFIGVSHEAVGEAMFYSPGENSDDGSTVQNNQWLGGWGLSWNDTYKRSGHVRKAAFSCSHFYSNYVVGWPLQGSDAYTGVTVALFNVFAFGNNLFVGASQLLAAASPSVPFAIAPNVTPNYAELENTPQLGILTQGSGGVITLDPPIPAAALPSSISGLTLWLESDRLVGKTDGAALASWTDLSGAGNNAVQATGADQPTYNSSRATIVLPNNCPVVTFDGVNDQMTCPVSTSIAQTVFVVACVPSPGTTVTLIGTSGSSGLFLYLNNIGTSLVLEGDSSFVILAASGLVADAWWHVYSASYANPGAAVVTVDGVATTGTCATALTASRTMVLGDSAHGSSFMAGSLGAVIQYNRVLTTTERQSVEAYLMNTFGVSR